MNVEKDEPTVGSNTDITPTPTIGEMMDAVPPPTAPPPAAEEGLDPAIHGVGPLGRIPGTNIYDASKMFPGAIDVTDTMPHQTKAWIGVGEDRVPALEKAAAELFGVIDSAYRDAMEEGRHDALTARRLADCAGRAKQHLKSAVVEARNAMVVG